MITRPVTVLTILAPGGLSLVCGYLLYRFPALVELLKREHHRRVDYRESPAEKQGPEVNTGLAYIISIMLFGLGVFMLLVGGWIILTQSLPL